MKLLLITTIALLTGCAAWTERGAVYETAIKTPDGGEIRIIDRDKNRVWSPSKNETWTYMRLPTDTNFYQVENAGYTHQNGVGPAVLTKTIEAGAVAGGAYFIGEGLKGSGDEVTNNNQSTTKQLQGQANAQMQVQTNKVKKQ